MPEPMLRGMDILVKVFVAGTLVLHLREAGRLFWEQVGRDVAK